MEGMSGYEAEAEFYDYAWETLKVDIAFYRRRLQGSHKVLDCMCGTGRVAIALARAGFRVDGIDSSVEMLRQARRRARTEAPRVRARLRWYCGDITQSSPSSDHDAAIIAVNSYGLILRESDRIRALQRIRAAVRQGGKLYLALDSVRSYRRIRDGVPFLTTVRPVGRGARTYLRVMVEFGSAAARARSTTLHALIGRSGHVMRTEVTETRTAVLSPSQVKKELVRAGFRVTDLCGDYDGSAYSPTGDRFIVEAVRA